MPLLTEIKEHLYKNRATYIVAGLVSLTTSLFLVVWRRWLFELLARRGQAIPREALGALIGVLLIWLLTSLILNYLFYREINRSRRADSEPFLFEITLEENDVRILKVIAASDRRVEPEIIAAITGLHLEIVKFHLHKLDEANYIKRSHGSSLLDQKGREYLITNKLLT